jgi:N-acetylglucosaminyldiphosphoundecaprenol N-acetyl-beta-D-mannosaminyltransferase
MAIEALGFEKPAAPKRALTEQGRLVELRRRLELAGALVDQVDLTTAVERIHGFLLSGAAHQVMTVNLDFLTIAQRDAGFRETINRADLAVADGMPLVWVSRLKGQPLAQRITGVELVDESCRLAAQTGNAVFLLGAAPGVADAAARRLEARYPRLRVAGVYSPPFGELSRAEDERIVAMIREAAPGLLFVAFGAPRQDLWIRAHLDTLHVPVAMGVGCVLDLLAGAVRRAPGWMQRTGLEWIHRLAQEPRRLWRRYLNYSPRFVLGFARQYGRRKLRGR